MTTRRVEMERFSLISSNALQSVLAALVSAVGVTDMAEFAKGRAAVWNSGRVLKTSPEEDSGSRGS